MSSRRRLAALTALLLAILLLAAPAAAAGARPAPAGQHTDRGNAQVTKTHATRSRDVKSHDVKAHAAKQAADRAAQERGQVVSGGSKLPAVRHNATARHGKGAATHGGRGHHNDAAGRSPSSHTNGKGNSKGSGKGSPARHPTSRPTAGRTPAPNLFTGPTAVRLPGSAAQHGDAPGTPSRSRTRTPIHRSTDSRKPPPLADVLSTPLSLSMGLIPVAIAILLAIGGIGLVALLSRRTR